MNFFVTHKRQLLIIGIFALTARYIYAFGFTNLHSDFYWEYGEIGKNVIHGKGYSFFYFADDERRFLYDENQSPLPSAYMPPGYVFFLIPFLTIDQIVVRNILLISIQILISVASIWGLFYFAQVHFSKKIAFLTGIIAALLPDFVHAISSFTPTILFHGCIIASFIILHEKESSNKYTIIFGILTSALLYLRSEYFLFTLLLIGILLIQHQWKKVVIISSLVILCLSPWIYRNQTVFHSFVPFTTSAGLNFYRGNNPIEIGAWGDETTKRLEKNLPHSEQLEIEFNNLFFNQGIRFVKEHPFEALQNIPSKLFDLWMYDRHVYDLGITYKLYAALFFLLFLFGVTKSSSKKYFFFYLFFLYFSVVVALFFCLPRYQTMMRIAMIPFVAMAVEFVGSKLQSTFKNFFAKRNKTINKM